MPPVTGGAPLVMDQRQFLAELTSIQKSLFDQASNYTKIIFGLGYAGFFGAWAGTRTYLRPWELVSSALLICLSLIGYISFEILQAQITSKAAIDLGRTLNSPTLQMSALVQYKERMARVQEWYFKAWGVIFYFCVATGILGAIILVEAFVHSLWRMI